MVLQDDEEGELLGSRTLANVLVTQERSHLTEIKLGNDWSRSGSKESIVLFARMQVMSRMEAASVFHCRVPHARVNGSDLCSGLMR